MKIKSVNLETVCGITSKLPDNPYPEFAFAGKSNVGKSTLINGLMNRKSYARTSAKPGKTATLNFYRIEASAEVVDVQASSASPASSADPASSESGEQTLGEQSLSFYLVDLPGYGYAKRSKSEVAKWGPMVERYLNTSKQLRTIFLLVDIRHEPTNNDIMMYDYIRSQGFLPVIIATKADKVSKSRLQQYTSVIRKTLAMPKDEILIPYSSMTKQGRDEIYALINRECVIGDVAMST